jgi:hypothetical protein
MKAKFGEVLAKGVKQVKYILVNLVTMGAVGEGPKTIPHAQEVG